MKQLTLLVTLFFLLSSYAQEIITFERNKKTEHLFDDNNPFSFISILQQNSMFLNHYNLNGMDMKTFVGLSQLEKESTYKFKGPETDEPLLDEFGEPLIVTLEDGTLSYAYPKPDSMFIDLFGIDRIEFTLLEGKDEPMKRLDKLHLWKQYDSGLHRVLTLDANVFMRFDGTNFIMPLDESQTQLLVGKSDHPTLWSTIRDSSLNRMKGFESTLTNGVFEQRWDWVNNDLLDIFPWPFRFNFYPSESTRPLIQENPSYHGYFEDELIFPVSTKFTDSVRNYLIGSRELQKKFKAIHYILAQDMIYQSDEFGDPLIQYNEYGYGEYIYYEPDEKYFFIDFTPQIFIIKRSICDSLMNCQITPQELLFCLKNSNGRPELISVMSLDFGDDHSNQDFLKPFVTDFKKEELWSNSEFTLLKTLINNKKYRKKLK